MEYLLTHMEYILTKTAKEGLVLTRNGNRVKVTDVLSVYPDRHVYALHGNMGAGKTTFIKQLCEEMGSADVVNSPTFAIVNVYEDGDGREMYHFDCYRLKNLGEALNLGAEEYLYSGNYCFIEWPDVIEAILPDDTVHLSFSVQEDGSRKLTIE